MSTLHLAADASISAVPAGVVNIVITIGVLFLIVRRSLRKRQLKEKVLLGLILSGIGLLEMIGYVQDNGATVGDLVIAGVSTIIGFVLAIIRAHTIRIWRENGVVYTQGGPLTAVLWVVGLGQHLLLDAFIEKGLGSVSLLLYFGLMILAQRWIVRERARKQHLIARRTSD